MTADFQQKKVYRLVGFTASSRISAHVKTFAKAAYSIAARRERDKAEAAAQKTAPTPALAAPARPPVLLCQSKQNTLKDVYRLALGEAGIFTTDARSPRTLSRDEALKQAGMRRKPKRAKPYESVAPQLRLRTAQAGLAATCGCTVRTLQRHLDDLQALGFVVVRQQLGLNNFKSPSFQLVLDASFLDWQEILLNQYGVATNTNTSAESGPGPAPGAAAAPDVPASPIAPPVDVFKALTVFEQMEAMRKKMAAPFANS